MTRPGRRRLGPVDRCRADAVRRHGHRSGRVHAGEVDRCRAADLGGNVSAIVLGSVVVFELIGPFAVGRALDALGETGAERPRPMADWTPTPRTSSGTSSCRCPAPAMARRKAPQIVDLAASTGAMLTGLHIVPPAGASTRTAACPRCASSGSSPSPATWRSRRSCVRRIPSSMRSSRRPSGDVDLIVLGEPYPRALDRGGGQRIVHEVARRIRPDIRVLVVPTLDRGPGESAVHPVLVRRDVDHGAVTRGWSAVGRATARRRRPDTGPMVRTIAAPWAAAGGPRPTTPTDKPHRCRSRAPRPAAPGHGRRRERRACPTSLPSPSCSNAARAAATS